MPRSEIKHHTVPRPKVQSSLIQKPLIPTPLAPVPLITPPSFGQTIKEGIGFGAGSAIGHRIIGAVLGPSTASALTVPPSESPFSKCVSERNAFDLCLKTKSQEDHCNNEILALTHCIKLN